VRKGVGGRQKTFEGAVGEFGAGVKQIFYFRGHQVLMINEQRRRGFGKALLFGRLEWSFLGVWHLKDFDGNLFHLERRAVREDRDCGFDSILL
jgi:hypothetical protein